MKPSDRRRQTLPSAFTLVELLVVIGIIVILIAILLPALQRARAQSQLVACQSNIRQIIQATMMYVGDNHSTFPPGRDFASEYQYLYPRLDPATNTNSSIDYIQDYLSPYLAYQITYNADPNGSGPNNPNSKGPVNLVWRDPALQSGNIAYYSNQNEEAPTSTQYRYNIPYAGGYHTSRAVSSPICMLFYCEIFTNWSNLLGSYPHFPGNGSKACINVGYVDGHVDTITYNQLINGGLYPLTIKEPSGIMASTGVPPAEAQTTFYKQGWGPAIPY